MEFKISYYGSNNEILASEVLNYGSLDMAQNSAEEQLKENFIKIKRDVQGREERILVMTNKIEKVTIIKNVSATASFTGF